MHMATISDREIEATFDSLNFMLRKARKNKWPKSPYERAAMYNQLGAALEPVYRAAQLTTPRKKPKCKHAQLN
jgi:hypothetical protein